MSSFSERLPKAILGKPMTRSSIINGDVPVVVGPGQLPENLDGEYLAPIDWPAVGTPIRMIQMVWISADFLDVLTDNSPDRDAWNYRDSWDNEHLTSDQNSTGDQYTGIEPNTTNEYRINRCLRVGPAYFINGGTFQYVEDEVEGLPSYAHGTSTPNPTPNDPAGTIEWEKTFHAPIFPSYKTDYIIGATMLFNGDVSMCYLPSEDAVWGPATQTSISFSAHSELIEPDPLPDPSGPQGKNPDWYKASIVNVHQKCYVLFNETIIPEVIDMLEALRPNRTYGTHIDWRIHQTSEPNWSFLIHPSSNAYKEGAYKTDFLYLHIGCPRYTQQDMDDPNVPWDGTNAGQYPNKIFIKDADDKFDQSDVKYDALRNWKAQPSNWEILIGNPSPSLLLSNAVYSANLASFQDIVGNVETYHIKFLGFQSKSWAEAKNTTSATSDMTGVEGIDTSTPPEYGVGGGSYPIPTIVDDTNIEDNPLISKKWKCFPQIWPEPPQDTPVRWYDQSKVDLSIATWDGGYMAANKTMNPWLAENAISDNNGGNCDSSLIGTSAGNGLNVAFKKRLLNVIIRKQQRDNDVNSLLRNIASSNSSNFSYGGEVNEEWTAKDLFAVIANYFGFDPGNGEDLPSKD